MGDNNKCCSSCESCLKSCSIAFFVLVIFGYIYLHLLEQTGYAIERNLPEFKVKIKEYFDEGGHPYLVPLDTLLETDPTAPANFT